MPLPVRVLLIFGTRPEAIKLCPLVKRLQAEPGKFEARVAVTGQHRGLLDQVLEVFGVTPHHDLNVMTPGQTLYQSTARILTALEPVFRNERPDLAIVQGDTTTTLCGALAAFYAHVPVGHVEAGLRTGDLAQPFPEEANRLLTGRLADIHWAATEWARDNLLAEGVPAGRIAVTGNTGIDAVLQVAGALERGDLPSTGWPQLHPERKLIVVTAHRRESFGQGIDEVCRTLLTLAGRADAQIVFPVHPNPNVSGPVHALLGAHPHIHLVEPLSYVPFVDLMRRARFLLTDSGGVQEEGPSLGKPILVMREKTERPEAVEAGTVRLVGTSGKRILEEAIPLLEDEGVFAARSRIHNPYGDGRACTRICELIYSFYGK